jgi:hypothetical protein
MLDTTEQTPRINLRICGNKSNVVDMNQVRRVKTPKETNRWKPIPHANVVDVTRNNLEDSGFEIVNEAHNLTKGGEHYFGMFQVFHESRQGSDRGTVVGMRNSHDKLFAAGLCAGEAPFICDNLIFHNDVVFTRKHVGEVKQELLKRVKDIIGSLLPMWQHQDDRVEAYKEVPLTDKEAQNLIFDVYEAGIKTNLIGQSTLAQAWEQWKDSDHKVFRDRNLNSLYNGFTEVCKGRNVMHLPKRSEIFHNAFDPIAGLEVAVENN